MKPQNSGMNSGSRRWVASSIFLPLEPVSPVYNCYQGPCGEDYADCPERSPAFDDKWKIKFGLVSFCEQINEQPCTYHTKNCGEPPQSAAGKLQVKIGGTESRVRNVFVLGIFHGRHGHISSPICLQPMTFRSPKAAPTSGSEDDVQPKLDRLGIFVEVNLAAIDVSS